MSRSMEDDRPGYHPIEVKKSEPLTPEQTTEAIETLTNRADKRDSGTRLIAWGIAIAIVLAVVSFLFPRPAAAPKATVDPAVITALQDSLSALRGEVAYLKAHTDTTGVSDLRERVTTLGSMVEQRATDLDRIQTEVNRYIINAPAR